MDREEELSRRELEIARAFAEGASYRAIAERLFIAPATVRTHLTAIYRKLGVSSKIELARRVGAAVPAPEAAAGSGAPAGGQHGRVAVMPFAARSPEERVLAAGLVQDVITRLAKLRSVRVIASGSVFALDERGVRGRDAAELLAADYLACGEVVAVGDRIHVSVELTDGASEEVLWAETFDRPARDALLAMVGIGDSIVSAISAGIETEERNRAVLKNPLSLDAWECFHRGLWHMYRFTAADNQHAQDLFRRAVRLDPTFARAHAGISFTHFQNAFLLQPEHRADEVARALEAAGESIVTDERDPSAHWALGRALWLKGDDLQARAALATSVELSPNFALGHYALAFVNSQSGDARQAVRAADLSHGLSPFDPLLFGIFGARAMALFRLGAFAEAADCAVKAAARPNAHVHIHAIAAQCLVMAGRMEEARRTAASVRSMHPGYRCDDFLTAFRFSAEDGETFRRAAARIGLG